MRVGFVGLGHSFFLFHLRAELIPAAEPFEFDCGVMSGMKIMKQQAQK